MHNKKNYNISLFGEFVDKSVESEFLDHGIGGQTKAAALVALIFGVIFMSFLGNDIYAIENTSSILIITITRVLFLIISIIVFLFAKRIMKHTNLFFLLTGYEAGIAAAYLVTLGQYNSLSYLSFLGLMVISLSIYVIPNKLVLTQIISVLMSILYFLYPAQKIVGLGEYDIYKMIVYQIILLIYCNVNASLTNSYKRKQFAAGRELLALSVTDPLTGIYNRAKFDEDTEKWINFSNRYGNPLSLILFDIDDFKRINDSCGHLAGDGVLKDIAAATKKSIRNTDVFARWGGEEFVILLPNTDIRQAGEIAERLRIYIQDNLCDPTKNITCSFGIATLEKGDTAQSLLFKADELLMKAKAGGKNRVACQAEQSSHSAIH